MDFTNEQIEKARNCKTIEEFKDLAKTEGLILNDEEAQNYFNLTRDGELSDEEMSNVAGGAKGGDWKYTKTKIFNVGCPYCNTRHKLEVRLYEHTKTHHVRWDLNPSRCTCGAEPKYCRGTDNVIFEKDRGFRPALK